MKKGLVSKRIAIVLLLGCFALSGSLLRGMNKRHSLSSGNSDVIRDALVLLNVFASLRQDEFCLGFSQVFNKKREVAELVVFATTYVRDTEELLPKIITLQDVVGITQQLYLRKRGQRRCETKDDFTEEERKKLYPIFSKMGFTKAIYPKRENYKYILLFGARVFPFQKRLSFLLGLFKNGQVKSGSLVVLTGQNGKESDASWRKNGKNRFDLIGCLKRKCLLPLRENWESQIKETPETEYELIKLMIRLLDLKKVPQASNVFKGITFVNTPLKTVHRVDKMGARKENVQPNTEDTIRHWVRTYSSDIKPGPTLGIFSQPDSPRMKKNMKRVLSREELFGIRFEEADIDAAGPGIQEDEFHASLAFDAVGRHLYAGPEGTDYT